MAAASPALRYESAASNYIWILVGAGLLAFAASAGVALAIGELQALWVALSLVTCVAVLFDFRVGVVALIALLPVSATSVFPHELMGVTGLNPINLMLAGTLASYVIHGRRQTGNLVPARLIWLYVAPIVFAGVIGAFHAEEIIPHFYETMSINFTGPVGYLRDFLVKPLIIVAVALTIGAAAARSQKPERFLIPIALSVWLVCLVEIVYVVASGVRLGDLAGRSARTFFATVGLHANDLGRLLAVAYALLLFSWWETKTAALKTFLFISMGVLTLGLMLTFSRGAFIGFLLVNAMFVAWKFNARTVGLALAAGALSALILPGAVIGRLMMGVDSGDVNTVSAGRIEEIWLPLLPEVLKTPLWGNGLNSIMWSYPMETGAMLTVMHPHNAYLEAWLDLGLIGFVLVAAYFWHVWRGFRALGSNAYLSPEMRGFFQGAAAGLLCFAVTGLVGSSLRPVWEFAYLWMAIGMMYGIAARRPTS
jgi:O-antigen ligase